MAVISQKVDYEEEIFCLLRRPTFVTTKVGKIIFGGNLSEHDNGVNFFISFTAQCQSAFI